MSSFPRVVPSNINTRSAAHATTLPGSKRNETGNIYPIGDFTDAYWLRYFASAALQSGHKDPVFKAVCLMDEIRKHEKLYEK